MLNGITQKERLFMQSPLANHMAWPIASPALNSTHKNVHFGSTAPNTSTCQKDIANTTHEAFSEAKMADGMESPLVIRKFIDHDNI